MIAICFLYCRNAPEKYTDSDGYFINMIAGAIAGAVVGGINAAINGENVLAGIGIGAITGAVAGAAVDVAVATGGVGMFVMAGVVGGASNVINTVATAWVNGKEVSVGEMTIDFILGTGFNMLAFGVSGGSLKRVGGKMIDNMVRSFHQSVFAKTIFRKLSRVTVQKIVKMGTLKIAGQIAKNVLLESAIAGVIAGATALFSKIWKVITGAEAE